MNSFFNLFFGNDFNRGVLVAIDGTFNVGVLVPAVLEELEITNSEIIILNPIILQEGGSRFGSFTRNLTLSVTIPLMTAVGSAGFSSVDYKLNGLAFSSFWGNSKVPRFLEDGEGAGPQLISSSTNYLYWNYSPTYSGNYSGDLSYRSFTYPSSTRDGNVQLLENCQSIFRSSNELTRAVHLISNEIINRTIYEEFLSSNEFLFLMSIITVVNITLFFVLIFVSL